MVQIPIVSNFCSLYLVYKVSLVKILHYIGILVFDMYKVGTKVGLYYVEVYC